MVKSAAKPSPSPSPSTPPRRTVQQWTAQCEKCLKWRKIPTQEEFEDLRSKIIEEPFSCSVKPGVSCSDPGDLEFDPSRAIWLAHKPNTPKTPPGFRVRTVQRKSFSRGSPKMDIYYYSPAGKQLRSSGDVAAFLASNQDQFPDLTPDDFSFVRPKLL